MRQYRFELFADYFQFYLQDERAAGFLGDAWTKEAVEQLIAVVPGGIGVGTVRNMDVPVLVEIYDQEPPLEMDGADHVNECSIEIPTGRLVVAGNSDYFPEAARIEVTPGTYRARITYSGLDTLSEDGLDGKDAYRVQLWPGSEIPLRVVKRRGG